MGTGAGALRGTRGFSTAQHGSGVRAASGPPSGTKLPTSNSGVVPAVRRDSAPNSGPYAPSADGPRVLLLEDDTTTRLKLEQIMSKRGAEVLSASSPSEAIYLMSMIDESVPRQMIAILDVIVPGLDGPLFVNALRADPRFAGAPVVLISALSAPALEKTMHDWRADGFILKSRGLLHVDQAFEAWFARLANRTSGVPSRRTPPSSSSVG